MKKLLFFLVIVLIVSCKRDKEEISIRNFGKEYEVFKNKAYFIFLANDIIYNDFTNTIDTQKYFLKEVIDTLYNDLEGNLTARIFQYKTLDTNKIWNFEEAIYKSINNTLTYRNINNKKQIKLSFPVNEETFWNVNNLNQDLAIFVFYTNIKKQLKFDNLTFNNTITIKSDPINNLIRERSYTETYAEKVGLIYRKEVNIEKPTSSVKRGFSKELKIIRYVL